jgi:hypothetical protein
MSKYKRKRRSHQLYMTMTTGGRSVLREWQESSVLPALRDGQVSG